MLLRRREMLPALAAPLLGQAAPPNIVVLLADDQRFNTIRALGNREIWTPNLDRLVGQGVAFTHAHIMGGTNGAVCIASRAMLLTGRSMFRLPAPLLSGNRNAAAVPTVTFPEYFRQRGYATHAIGKWHNGTRSFARSFTSAENVMFGGMADHLKTPVNGFDASGEYPAAKERVGEKFSSELFTDSALDFLGRQKAGNPYLMYVAYTAPHDPRMAPAAELARYKAAQLSVPKNFLPRHPFDNGELEVRDEKLAPWPRTPEVVREHLAAYYAMITHLDGQIGRVLHAIEKSGQVRNTIVVFAGDNGLALGQHGLMGKQSLYEHSTRVPLVVRGPGVAQGQRKAGLCYLHDLFPTLCELSGQPVPEGLEARSLMGAPRSQVLLAYRDLQRAVRTERYKLIEYPKIAKTQVFDVQKDPWEMRDLSADAALVGPLRERLRAEQRAQGDALMA